MSGAESMGGARAELERGIAFHEEEHSIVLAAVGNATDGREPAIECGAEVSAARGVTYEIVGDLGRVATSMISVSTAKGEAVSHIELACSRASIAGNTFGRVRGHLQSAAIHGVGMSLQVGDLAGHAETVLSKATDALAIYSSVTDEEEPVPIAIAHKKTVEDFTGQVLPPLVQAVGQVELELIEFDGLCDSLREGIGLLATRCNELLQAADRLPAHELADWAGKIASGAGAAIRAVENLGLGIAATSTSLTRLAASFTMIKGYLQDEVQVSLEATLQSARDRAARL